MGGSNSRRGSRACKSVKASDPIFAFSSQFFFRILFNQIMKIFGKYLYTFFEKEFDVIR